MATLGKFCSFVCYDREGLLRLIECDYVLEYAYIFHDKDKEIDPETGEIQE